MSDEDKKKRRNPWGNGNNSNEPVRGPWGNGSGGRGPRGPGGEPPDLDELIKKARENMDDMIPGGINGKIFALGLLLLFAVFYIYQSVYIIQPAEHGVVQRFGEWVRTQDTPGAGWHLWPVESVTKVNVTDTRRISIGFQEGIASNRRGGQAGQIRSVPEESLMLTSDRNIVDINLVVQWNINSASDFMFNVEDQEGTIKKVAESAIREVVGQNNMFPIITQARQEIAERTKEILQKNLDDYNSGINVINILIEKAEVHPQVQGAFQDVQSAKQDAENIQNEAQAYREEIIPKARGAAIQMLQQAEGYKQSTIARATGDADRFNSVLEAYRTGEDVTKRRIYIETMENVLLNANKIILDQEQGSQGIVPFLPLNELMRQNQGQPQQNRGQ